MKEEKPFVERFKSMRLGESTELGMLIPLIIIMAATQVLNPHFLSYTNIVAMLKSIPFISLATLGGSLVLISGNVDISVGRVAGLAGMYFGYAYTILQLPFIVSLLIGLAVGAVIGLVNGFLTVCIGMSSFMATMGTLYICGGWRYLVNNGDVMTLGDEIRSFSNQTPLGVSWVFWFAILFFVIIGFVQRKTVYGRRIYAIGNNREVARLQGVKVKTIDMSVFLISGLLAALAGIMATMDINSAQPSTGTGWEFKAVAGSVIGGVSLSGGSGTAFGVAIGVFMVFVISNIINMINLSNYWSDVFTGGVLLAAVLIDLVRKNRKVKG